MKLYAAELDFGAVAEEFGIQRGFPPHLHAQAGAAVDRFADSREDLLEIEFVTIDPAGSLDLDQAVCIEHSADGFRVHYAIADVVAFIAPGSELERESLKRGQTIYLPDEPARLHPEELSENRASLLEGKQRPAVVWTIDLDEDGEIIPSRVQLRRAIVKSRARLNYDEVQAAVDAGTAHPSIHLLPIVGQLRQKSALRRDAINLNIPSQRVVRLEGAVQGGHYEIIIEPRHPIMDYNSEISLLTGMVAGNMMVEAGHGLLRTLAPANNGSEVTFRAEARALGYPIAPEQHIGEFLHTVDSNSANGMAVQREAQKLLRGSGYLSIAPGVEEIHSGVGGHYAHVTAPLRRLVDRFATEHCLAIANGYDTPQWVLNVQDKVLESMKITASLAAQVDNACLDLAEATVLEPWVAQNFKAVVLTSDDEKQQSRLFVADPPVLARCLGAPPQGTAQDVTLVSADVVKRIVQFVWPAD